MIVCDASVVIDWLEESETPEADRLAKLAVDGHAFIAPVTITEVLSGPATDNRVERALGALHVLPVRPGYWIRAGELRRRLITARRKAGLADALTAQACLDHDMPLLARDSDYRAFAELAGLKLA